MIYFICMLQNNFVNKQYECILQINNTIVEYPKYLSYFFQFYILEFLIIKETESKLFLNICFADSKFLKIIIIISSDIGQH